MAQSTSAHDRRGPGVGTGELLGVEDEAGTVEVGKRADLVVWDGTELDVSDLRSRVHQVIQDGAIVSQAA